MKKPRLKIGVDLDGTLIQPNAVEFFDWLTRRGQKACLATYARSGCWENATGLNSCVLTELYTEFLGLDQAPLMQPNAGAQEALVELCRSDWLYLITARGTQLEVVSRQGLDAAFAGATFTAYMFGYPNRKWEAMQEQGINVIIEDSPHEAELVIRNLPNAYVIGMPNPHIEGWFHHQRLMLPAASLIDCRGKAPAALSALTRTAWTEVLLIIDRLRPTICGSSITKIGA